MTIGKGPASRYNRRLRVERPIADESFAGAGSGEWEHVGDIWASVQDVLPSRAERLGEGINITSRPARVRTRYRNGINASTDSGITSSMRFVMGDRIMQIVSGPAEVGFREELEFMVEEYSPAGGGA